jgi:hypothetical protein
MVLSCGEARKSSKRNAKTWRFAIGEVEIGFFGESLRSKRWWDGGYWRIEGRGPFADARGSDGGMGKVWTEGREDRKGKAFVIFVIFCSKEKELRKSVPGAVREIKTEPRTQVSG